MLQLEIHHVPYCKLLPSVLEVVDPVHSFFSGLNLLTCFFNYGIFVGEFLICSIACWYQATATHACSKPCVLATGNTPWLLTHAASHCCIPLITAQAYSKQPAHGHHTCSNVTSLLITKNYSPTT
ncbi:hypothetical protein ACB098_10G068000 [Castanea mollissima]